MVMTLTNNDADRGIKILRIYGVILKYLMYDLRLQQISYLTHETYLDTPDTQTWRLLADLGRLVPRFCSFPVWIADCIE